MSTPGDQVGQAPSVRVPKRFPLVSRPGFRSTTLRLNDPTVLSPVSDAAMFNCYAELDPEDNQYWVEKRLGTSTVATVAAGAAGGIGTGYAANWPTPLPISIFGPNMYIWFNGAMTPVTYSGGTGNPLIQGRAATFVQIPSFATSPLLCWAANGSLWGAALAPAANNFRYSNAADFIHSVPWTASLCDGVVYLDGTTYVMDQSSNIWGSNVGDVTTWVATTVIQAGGRADIPVCLAQQLEYIIAFKSTSLRCFYDAGAAAQTAGVGSNLAWVEGADANFGIANAASLQLIDQTLVWLTNNDKSTPQIARMDGLQVQIISTPPVERLLQSITMAKFSAEPSATTNVVYSSGIKRGGHRFYVLTVPAAATINSIPFTLVYDLDQQMWYLWYSNGTTLWNVTSVSAHSGVDSGIDSPPGVFCQDLTNGSFYVTDIDQVYTTDSGTPCQVDIYTPNADMNTRRRKQLNAMYFVNDQVSGSSMMVRKSDDDFRSWSPFRRVSLAVKQPSLTRCGTFRRRALNLRHAAADPFRIKASDVQIDLGSL